jgi:GWxTD domain-containing protein
VFSNPAASVESILFKLSFKIEPKQCAAYITIQDQISMSMNTYRCEVMVRDLSSDILQVSDILFAENIAISNTPGRFTKYGKDIIPNPLRIYGINRPFLFMYYEIYHMDFDKDSPDGRQYSIKTTILDENGNVLIAGPERTRKKAGRSSVIFDKVRLHRLKGIRHTENTSRFVVRVEVRDFASGKKSSSVRDFYFIHGPATIHSHDKQSITEERLDEIIKEIQPIALDGELDIFPELNHNGKINFLRDFWKRRDPTPETSVNEYTIEYYEKLKYVDEAFAEGNYRRGILTDRGRVYLKYGAPTEINNHDHDINMKPYIEWIYYQESRRAFIFSDIGGFGRFRLIHSTWPGELSDEQWQDRITINPEQ